MNVDEYVELLRSDPRTSDVGGTRYDTVVSMEAKTRKAYHETTGDRADILLVWRSWFALKTLMIRDGIAVCPHGYRWDPLSLTC